MKTAIRKNERVLNLLAYLLGSRGVVAFARIRTEVDGYNEPGTAEATVARRFERDKETLRALGVDAVYCEDPAGGGPGYAVAKPGAYMGDIVLCDGEVRLVTVLAALRTGSSSAIVENLTSACQKLLARSALGEGAEKIGARHLVYPAGTAADRRLSANLQAIGEALERRRRVHFTYYSIGRDEVGQRTVEPYGLKFFKGQWYLVGACLRTHEVRTFRLDRIRDRVRLLSRGPDPEFDVPLDFKLDDYVGRSPWQLARRKAVKVMLELDEVGAWLVQEARPPGLTLAPGARGATARLEVRNEEGLFKWVASLGTHARITRPDSVVRGFLCFLRDIEHRCLA